MMVVTLEQQDSAHVGASAALSNQDDNMLSDHKHCGIMESWSARSSAAVPCRSEPHLLAQGYVIGALKMATPPKC